MSEGGGTDELEELKSKNEALESKVKSSQTLVESLKKSRDELQEKLDQMVTEAKEKEAVDSLLEQKCVDAQQKLDEMTQERDQLNGQLGEVTQERDQLKGQLEETTKERDQLKLQSDEGDEAEALKHKEQEKKEAELDDSADEALKHKEQEREAELTKLTSEREELLAKVSSLEHELAELRSTTEARPSSGGGDDELERLREELKATTDASREITEELEMSLAQEQKRVEEALAMLDEANKAREDAQTQLASFQQAMEDDGAKVGEQAAEALESQRALEDALFTKDKELDSERAMRRALEAKYEEKAKLKLREIEALTAEIRRLKKAGEQLPTVLQELDRTKQDAEDKVKAKEQELRRATAAFNATEAERSKLEQRMARQFEEITTWEARVKKAEEIRWRAGMELAKAKAELDWRARGEQEREFHIERMKDEVERLKSKLVRAEMRKLRVEEALEECVVELRSKKREMEQMKHKVEGLVDFFSNSSHRPPMQLVPNLRAERNISEGRQWDRNGRYLSP